MVFATSLLMKKLKFRKYLRILHRDLGYFFVGLTIIYGVSGIILNYKAHEEDPAYKEYAVSENIQANLSPAALEEYWQRSYENDASLNRIIPVGDVYRIYVKGGIGQYNPMNGAISYTIYKEKKFVKFINVIHYNTGKKFTWLANIFAGSLMFFALSGLIMLKGKNGFLRRGIWFMIIGLAVPVIWYFIVM